MQFIIRSNTGVIWKGLKFNPKQDDQFGIASGQMRSAYKEYSPKFKDCIVELEWIDEQGLYSLEIDTETL